MIPNPDPNPGLRLFGEKCFEIHGRGLGWCVVLGRWPAWYGRGPGGILLGPFRTRSGCGAALLSDIKDSDSKGTVAWRVTEASRGAAMRAYARLEASITNEPNFPTYRMILENESDRFSVAGPDGVVEGFWSYSLVEASNKASEERIAFASSV